MPAVIYSIGLAVAVVLTRTRYRKRAPKKSSVPPTKSSAPDVRKSLRTMPETPTANLPLRGKKIESVTCYHVTLLTVPIGIRNLRSFAIVESITGVTSRRCDARKFLVKGRPEFYTSAFQITNPRTPTPIPFLTDFYPRHPPLPFCRTDTRLTPLTDL